MTKEIIQLHNQYSPWTNLRSGQNTCWFKGSIFHKNKLLNDTETADLLSSIASEEKIIAESLSELNGEYAMVIETPETIITIVDRVRSIPLFYAETDRQTIISDDANHIREAIPTELNELNAAEFLLTGFVTGSDTLFNDIRQLQAGEYLIYDKKRSLLRTDRYHRFLHGNYFPDSEDILLEKLDQVFLNVFRRLVATTVEQGKRIVVPLSGGLDSRIIVAMLKRLGVEDVICFTYGKKGNKEADISRQVAEALGYEWHFVEYTKEKWYDCYHSKDMKDYQKYAGNLVSLPHLQDFLALKIMKEEGILPENAVFVPGHSGDMLAGSHIPLDYDQTQTYNFEKFLEDSLNKHYNLWKYDEIRLRYIFKERIKKSVGAISVHDNESCANVIEYFNFKERQAKFIVNSVRIYEFFGYTWQIPLWDAELIDYFLRINIEKRINQTIYISYTNQNCFVKSSRTLFAIECTTNLNNKSTQKIHICSLFINYLLGRYFIFEIGWSLVYKHPLWQKIVTYACGTNINPVIQHPFISQLIINSNKARFVPSTNGIMSYEFLKQYLLGSK